MRSKSVNWFLYDNGLRLERVKTRVYCSDFAKRVMWIEMFINVAPKQNTIQVNYAILVCSIWKRDRIIIICFIFRNLMSKYGPFCRRLTSDDGDTTYLCILNPGNLDMFFMCESNEPNHKMVNSNYFLAAPTDDFNPF